MFVFVHCVLVENCIIKNPRMVLCIIKGEGYNLKEDRFQNKTKPTFIRVLPREKRIGTIINTNNDNSIIFQSLTGTW